MLHFEIDSFSTKSNHTLSKLLLENKPFSKITREFEKPFFLKTFIILLNIYNSSCYHRRGSSHLLNDILNIPETKLYVVILFLQRLNMDKVNLSKETKKFVGNEESKSGLPNTVLDTAARPSSPMGLFHVCPGL